MKKLNLKRVVGLIAITLVIGITASFGVGYLLDRMNPKVSFYADKDEISSVVENETQLELMNKEFQLEYGAVDSYIKIGTFEGQGYATLFLLKDGERGYSRESVDITDDYYWDVYHAVYVTENDYFRNQICQCHKCQWQRQYNVK